MAQLSLRHPPLPPPLWCDTPQVCLPVCLSFYFDNGTWHGELVPLTPLRAQPQVAFMCATFTSETTEDRQTDRRGTYQRFNQCSYSDGGNSQSRFVLFAFWRQLFQAEVEWDLLSVGCACSVFRRGALRGLAGGGLNHAALTSVSKPR